MTNIGIADQSETQTASNRKPLHQVLFDKPYSFEFFQAVRLLEKIFPERRTVGRDALPHQEAVRFRSRVTLDFPSSEIYEIRDVSGEADDDSIREMIVSFMGMVGVSGVLPSHYSEFVLDRIRHRDTAMWTFLDIFTHRSVSMFYRAWAKYRFPVGYEQGDDDFTSYLFDFAGVGTRGLRGRMSLDDEALLPYAGLIAQKPHSVNAVENVLADHFGVDAKVDQFFGQWLVLNEVDTTALGTRSSVLGRTALVGSRVWDQQSKFRVRMGAMGFKQFREFLPDGSAHKALANLIRFMVGTEFDFDVQLVLQNRQVPGSVLTTRAMRRPMLGWTSYLKTKPFTQDDEQVVLRLDA